MISNLNILENIAIIKEVHEHMPTRTAQALAVKYLEKIEQNKIGNLRVNNCSISQICDVMLVRALMSNNEKVIILPLASMDDLQDIRQMLKNIVSLNQDKTILILDIIENEIYYKGCSECNIVK